MIMKSLYSKFAFITIMIMIVSGIISFFLSNAYYQVKLKQQNDAKITNFALEIADFAGKHPVISLEEYFDHVGTIGYQLLVITADGNRQYFGSPFRKRNLPVEIPKKVLQGEIYHGIREFPHKTFVTGFFANELKNSVGVPFEYQGKKYALFIRPDIKLMFNEMHVLFGWLLILSILLSIVFVLISTKFLVEPIRKLNRATKEISEGNFSIKLDIDRRDELGHLAANFTSMSEKLARVDMLRRELISNITHDIQSPLTNIKGYIKMLEDTQKDEREKRQSIKIVQSEVDRLSEMTKQLLLLSSIESKRDLMDVEKVNIASQIKTVIHQYQWSMMEKGIMISFTLPNTSISGDPNLLYSVWENLITNAIKYNRENGSIDVQLIEEDSQVTVIVKDTGIGMNEAEKDRIFDRFYRADRSRDRSVQGTGLGLSIVKSIIDLHHGDIEIESETGEGTLIKVIIPK
ncbi:sensor histidine kinase [Neobacillus kokaensis]|uniref:Heme sensor protein HssS n=1 Tax=Neobacillus kokaensis TaxID=2759023 RepID=A0ABQ3NA41_9BACI|nr:HAMP domain-containing sensor histidine kinase [Neobacillus kokaensis]GHI00928.1 two-component sensor histidine kinase [Neobacillus kokaensis]